MVANLCGDLIFVHTCGDISFIHTCEDSIIFVLTCKDIIFNSNFVPHHVTAYKFGGVCLKHLWISFESLWQSLVIFRIFRKCLKIFGKCLETFVWPSDKFWKVLRNFWKVVGSFRKIAKKRYVFWHFVTFNKKTITWSLGDLNFLFSFWKNISLVHCTHLNKMSDKSQSFSEICSLWQMRAFNWNMRGRCCYPWPTEDQIPMDHSSLCK